MKKEQNQTEKQLCELGYEIISGFVTKNQFPLGRLEKEFVTPELISPKRLIIEQELEKCSNNLKKI